MKTIRIKTILFGTSTLNLNWFMSTVVQVKGKLAATFPIILKRDLIFIGSNLSHCRFTDSLTRNESETVIQMKPDFLGESFF